MAAVDCSFATLDDALRASNAHQSGGDAATPAIILPNWKTQRRQVFRSVFQTDISQPTPHATPVVAFPNHGQAFGVPLAGGGGGEALPSTHRGPAAEPMLSQSQDSEDLELPDAHDEEGSGGPRQGRQGPHGSNVSFARQLLQSARGSSASSAADDQIRFDRAWHVVTARIALPSSVAVEDSFGTLPPESQIFSSQDATVETEFQEALRLVLHAGTMLPRAAHVEDVLSWHTQQVRRHYAQHVLPMLSACTGEAPASIAPGDTRYYDHHMNVVVNSVRTLEAAFRLYLYGLMLLARGLATGEEEQTMIAVGEEDGPPAPPTAEVVVSRFRQDVNALVANSTPEGLTVSLRIVFTRFASVILGFDPPKADEANSGTGSSSNTTPFRRRSAQGAPISPSPKQKKSSSISVAPPRPPADNDSRIQLLRQQMYEILVPLHNVGLAGENFQILFAEIMDEKMTEFVQLSFAGGWSEADVSSAFSTSIGSTGGRLSARMSKGAGSSSACIATLNNWIENHFARLAHEVLGRIGVSGATREAVSLSDVIKWKEVALGRLSALRMTELFDIVLNWPQSRAGLEDLRVSVTTPQRRSQLVSTFSAALRKRLLHPACSTLEILQIYVAMIRTFHALDPSNVLLGAAVGPLQFYLCQREDAVRIVVDGLLADPESSYAANSTVADRIARTRSGSTSAATTPSADNAKLVELASILNDPSQQRRRHIDEEELDWNDMEWVPDPIDAGTNYRRPKSEDVIGTLISALGSREAFTKEFQSIIAERLLSPQVVFAKEVKVLNLLKKRFGESSLQSCEVMIRDIQDSNRLDAIIDDMLHSEESDDSDVPITDRKGELEYKAKILSRLYWPAGLGREHFLLPRPVADMQQMYDTFYEERKTGRKLAWLNHLGQAHVELELEDRTVALDCKTHEATVIYAFQGNEQEVKRGPVSRSVPELEEMLQMDDDLIVSALVFWQKQGVLRQDPKDPERYSVIEDLAKAKAEEEAQPQDNQAAAAAAATAAPATSKSQARADDAQRTVYWQFIVGMLTNSAASMPLAQIAMMMKMLMAEGFPWSNEELQEFLGDKVAEGVLEVAGGKYRLVKK
ncbi:hypothetical protein SEUCBS139899_001320 [Sporothrix eucalyptigena]|uniref:Anaphase-promoting complex subunit 2 n=1 Tax=Sporothrix eucalyptigena TaxID=1812306 RepID=A0ABP0CVL8_9PEZI